MKITIDLCDSNCFCPLIFISFLLVRRMKAFLLLCYVLHSPVICQVPKRSRNRIRNCGVTFGVPTKEPKNLKRPIPSLMHKILSNEPHPLRSQAISRSEPSPEQSHFPSKAIFRAKPSPEPSYFPS